MMFMGLDGGGTKVECALVTDQGELVGRTLGGAVNTNFSPVDAVMASFQQVIRQALHQAGSDGSDVAAVVVGSPTKREVLGEILTRCLPRAQRLCLGEGCLALAAGDVMGQGVSVISGTGSLAYGQSHQGFQVSVGGWGSLLGDEGSGYAIGVEALRAVCRAADGRIPATGLCECVKAWAGVGRIRELSRVVYGPPMASRTEIAALARLVSDVAEAGDRVAEGILDTAGRQLADQAHTVIRRLSLQDVRDLHVVAAGGVLRNSRFVYQAFSEGLRVFGATAHVHHALVSPALGAAAIALERRGFHGERLRLMAAQSGTHQA